MRVKAASAGEHPVGKWRQPGEVFEYGGTTPGRWMVNPDGSPIEVKAKPAPKPKAKPAAAEE